MLVATPAVAQDRLCDPAFENCRTQLLNLINAETVGIDVAFWFMEDSRYSSALIKRHQAGVPVRILMDTRHTSTVNATVIQALAGGGVPMRRRTTSAIQHWKMMLFAGQRVVEFGSANFSVNAFVPNVPYQDYVDETVFFTDDDSVVNSFMTMFDRWWVDTSSFGNYANVTSRTRHYPSYSIDPELNFTPGQSFATRSIALYEQETVGMDVIMYRVTDQDQSDAIIDVRRRGVPVRFIHEQTEYRNIKRLWDSWNVDRMWAAGVQVRIRGHLGLNHQKSVILKGLRTIIFGSSNWTGPSDNSQQEHNYFVHSKDWMYHVVRQPVRTQVGQHGGGRNQGVHAPAARRAEAEDAGERRNGAVTRADPHLVWRAVGALLRHLPRHVLVAAALSANRGLGPSETTSQNQKFVASGLAANKTYYWKIVSKTAANKSASSTVRSFTTGG